MMLRYAGHTPSDGAERAREKAVQLYIELEDVESLARLSEDPKFEGSIDARAALYVAARTASQIFRALGSISCSSS